MVSFARMKAHGWRIDEKCIKSTLSQRASDGIRVINPIARFLTHAIITLETGIQARNCLQVSLDVIRGHEPHFPVAYVTVEERGRVTRLELVSDTHEFRYRITNDRYGSMSLPFDVDALSSFDPAIHLHSEVHDESNVPDSADLLELNRHLDQVKEQKTKHGVVIQHRAWKVQQAFRSEEDYPIGDSCFSGTINSF